jgi:hypothetical protein
MRQTLRGSSFGKAQVEEWHRPPSGEKRKKK